MNLTVVKGLLRKTQVQIDTAESGYECLHMATKEKYDIIFLDHRMPGIDGIETLHRMKALPGSLNGETPVVALTANAVSGAREEYMKAGFDGYLTKPIDSSQLETMMIKFLPAEKVSLGEGTETAQPPVPKAPSLPAWLSDVEGISTADGVKNCGSEEAYLDALAVFAEHIVPGAKEIVRFYEEGDWENYTVKVHALKSSARIIGARELSDRARRLEDAGNKGYIDEIKSGTEPLVQLYLGYAQKLDPIMPKKPEPDAADLPPIDSAALAEAYETLREVAASFDYDTMMFVLDSLAAYSLPEEDSKRIGELREAAAGPDWDRIGTLVASNTASRG